MLFLKLGARLTDDGLPVVTLQQGWVTQAPAVKELERAIIARTFRHDGSPVLKWNFENISVHTDSAGNRTFHKGRSRGRIDGASACWMAIARASAGDITLSIHDRPELWGEAPAKSNEAPTPEGDGTTWDPTVLQDFNHPKFAEHKARFERWHELQED